MAKAIATGKNSVDFSVVLARLIFLQGVLDSHDIPLHADDQISQKYIPFHCISLVFQFGDFQPYTEEAAKSA